MSPSHLTDNVYRLRVNKTEAYLEVEPSNAVRFAALDKGNQGQLWNIALVPGTSAYKVTSFNKNYVLAPHSARNHHLCVHQADAITWNILQNTSFSQLVSTRHPNLAVDRDEHSGKATLRHVDAHHQYQQFIFELVENAIQTQTAGTAFQNTYFTLTPAEAQEQGPYDIIIIGAGYGGGVLAADLYETNSKIGERAKKVLILERGELVFHSHCLNSSRPTGRRSGRDQFNHTFYTKFKSDYNVTDESKAQWGGGPVYGVGGRSAIWSLAVPRPHDRTLRENFPSTVVDDLLKTWYTEAEKLVHLILPKTAPQHRELLERLTLTADGSLDADWSWATIASENRESRNFDFGEGAFSTIDKLLEIAMNKPTVVGPDGKTKFVEHKNWKILLGAEAREILWAKGNSKKARGVRAKTSNGIVDFDLSEKGIVVSSAGSVHSAAILLRSGVDLGGMGGLHITDHNILVHNSSFRYRNPADRQVVGSLKIQSHLNLPPIINERYSDLSLLSLYIDSSPFLYRGQAELASNDVPGLATTYMMRTPLDHNNTITLDSITKDPIVKILRTSWQASEWDNKVKAQKDFLEGAKKVMADVLKVDFLPDAPGDYFIPLPLGGGGHEMGTVPMGICVDEYHKLKDHENIYLADNSIFPFVPEANPSLTLSALTLRLSRYLVPRDPVEEQANHIAVVNHSGAYVKVAVSINTPEGEMLVEGSKEFGPGHYHVYERSAEEETVFVYKLDLTQPQPDPELEDATTDNEYDNLPWVYLKTPEYHTVRNGKLFAIN